MKERADLADGSHVGDLTELLKRRRCALHERLRPAQIFWGGIEDGNQHVLCTAVDAKRLQGRTNLWEIVREKWRVGVG